MVKRLEKPSTSNTRTVTFLPQNEPILQLEANIRTFVRTNQMSPSMYESRAQLVDIIAAYLKSDRIAHHLAPEGIIIKALTAFGSFATHCATKDSDLDLCVCATSEVKGALAVTVLQAINRDLRFHPEVQTHFGEHIISEILFVQAAKVPIIRFKIDGISVDLSATLDAQPPRTSLAAKYINAYCQLDERFLVLVIFLKMWMKCEGDAEDHLRDYPNSYSIILMLIHVLQWYDVLPNLHATHSEMFHMKHFSDWEMVELNQEFRFPLDENTIALHKEKWTHSLSIVQLLKLFALHYSSERMLAMCRLNMKNGQIEERANTHRQEHSIHPIQILDPYDKRNPARSARSAENLTNSLQELLNLMAYPNRDLFANVLKVTQDKRFSYQNSFFQPLPPRMYNQMSMISFPQNMNAYGQQPSFPTNPYYQGGPHANMYYYAPPPTGPMPQYPHPPQMFYPGPNQQQLPPEGVWGNPRNFN